jgi:hypothetical protein
VILVATPATQPALANVAAGCLARLGHEPIVLLNRAPPGAPPERTEGWAAGSARRVPESRMGAQLALGGREPRGEMGRAVAALADRCGDPASR